MTSIPQLISPQYFPGCSNSFAARLAKQGSYGKIRGPALNEEIINKVSKNTLFLFKYLEPGEVEITLGCEENSVFKIFQGDNPTTKSETFKRQSFIVRQNQEMAFSIFFNRGTAGNSSKIEISVIRRGGNPQNTKLEFTLTISGHNLPSRKKDKPFYQHAHSWINNVAFFLAEERANIRLPAKALHQEPIFPPSDENHKSTEQPLLIISDNSPQLKTPSPLINVPREALNYFSSEERADFFPLPLPLIVNADLYVPTSTIMGE